MRASGWVILSAVLMLTNAVSFPPARAAEGAEGTTDVALKPTDEALSLARDRLRDELTSYRSRLKDDPPAYAAPRRTQGAGTEPAPRDDLASLRRPDPKPGVLNDEVRTQDLQARAQRKLDDDERRWKQLTHSICVACGTSSPPVRTAPVTPGDVLARRPSPPTRDPVSQPSETAQASGSGPVAAAPQRRLRYAKLRRQILGQSRPVAGLRQRARLTPRYARLRRQLLSQARPIGRIHRRSQHALLHASGHRRLARARLRYAGQAWRARRVLARAPKVASIRRRFVVLGGTGFDARDRGHPPARRNRQPYALCTYGYGSAHLQGGLPTMCVSAQ
ncbi:hypothetical protein [Methylobacterium planeticum]|uniref:Uncharacterized protein n=1 Tax=Methylobacterium planeticum TaxID=2615211 RepID=A0A6N6MJQ3_9HYPH|nr:hypothetical protein [Methylobacterium planeticum]KAB1070742.1 hypothetical protein F6X51_21450 [Methylobacterium planeticum]